MGEISSAAGAVLGSAVVRRKTPQSERYAPPESTSQIGLFQLLDGVRDVPTSQRDRLTLSLPGFETDAPTGGTLFYAGDLDLARRPAVAIVGSRKVSDAGAKRAWQLARDLVKNGVVVVSGLAAGVDFNAHRGAIQSGGRTIAVIGTPLDRAYPAENARVQELIYREHLLMTPFPVGAAVTKINFPTRNKFMAAISDATVIIEASDTSGSLHQAAECRPDRLNRWLFIAESVAKDPSLEWPARFLGAHPKARVLSSVDDILKVLTR